MSDQIERVGVIGAGQMGAGIAEVSARAGVDVMVYEPTEALTTTGTARITKSLERGVSVGKITERECTAALAKLKFTTSLADLSDRQLVIEAVIEDETVKRKIFAELDKLITDPDAVLASNTSSIPIMKIAAATQNPGRVLGLHFFNPVPLMKLVEVVQSILTEDATVAAAYEWVQAVGKVPVKTKDSTAFIVNRLLVPYLLDAIREYERGLGTIEDIDKGMKLGCGHPMGPFTLLDFVGLDTTYYIANIMFEEFREPRFAPPPLLKRMVLAGYHGRKTKRGFYTY